MERCVLEGKYFRMDRPSRQVVEASDKHMERALDLGLRAEGSGFMGASFAEFESAAKLLPNCPRILECCYMVETIRNNMGSAREYHTRASRNQDNFVSETTKTTHMLVWRKFMRLITRVPLRGEQMEFRHEATLPPLEGKETQVFRGVFHFSPAIQSVGENTELTLTLEYAEIGVSNSLTEPDLQGYFPYEFEMKIFPYGDWFRHYSKLSTVKHLVPQSPQQVQQQATAGYEAQICVGGSNFIPTANFTYTRGNGTSTFILSEGMEASKGRDDEKAMRIMWKVNTYADGKPFVLKPVYKIRQLPYEPTHHVCTNSGPFQGKWILPRASDMEYNFEWKVELVAKFALFRRSLKRELSLRKPMPLFQQTSCTAIVKSNFYQSSMEHNFQ
ncbi:hypothetical protein M758_5G041900 [Ceratodon purpureus]|nr:hypothetical protein M758_5G041900 [Ceratodon purpureus]